MIENLREKVKQKQNNFNIFQFGFQPVKLMHDKLDGNTKVQQNEMKIYCCLVLDTHGMAT